ncbi:MAG: hypothetical protein V4805_20920 [Pseudomonadota bacterium]
MRNQLSAININVGGNTKLHQKRDLLTKNNVLSIKQAKNAKYQYAGRQRRIIPY